VQLNPNQEGQRKMQSTNYAELKKLCDKNAQDLQFLQDTLLSVKFPEIKTAISLLQFVSKYICEEQNA
jgi:hypothetical protein